jgi:hypothetical protein
MSKRHRRIRALPGDCPAALKRQLPTLQAMVRQARSDPPPCLLCGAPVGAGATVHTFTPDDTATWGIPRGLLASSVYTLCPTCSTLEDVQPRVLAVLWQEWQERQARLAEARTAFRWN